MKRLNFALPLVQTKYVLDRMLFINKPCASVSKNMPNQIGSFQWFAGLLGLCLLVFINLQPAFVATAIWLTAAHGHEHQVTVHADGNHLDVRLSHTNLQEATDHEHEQSLPLVIALYSAHDHEENDHVLHFSASDVPDQIKCGKVIAPSFPQQWAVQTTSLTITTLASTIAAPESAARPPPSLAAGLLCLRTTVLLI